MVTILTTSIEYIPKDPKFFGQIGPPNGTELLINISRDGGDDCFDECDLSHERKASTLPTCDRKL